MHLVLPFASALGPEAEAALHRLALPRLDRLLARHLAPAERLEGDEFDLNLPHERLLASRPGGAAPQDGLVPLAAEAARADGLPVDAAPAGTGWALLSPSHWLLGTEQVSLLDPEALALDEAGSRAFFEAVRPLFEDDGWTLHWGAPQRWYAAHPSLATLRSASLDRVIGRNVDLWLNEHPEQRQALRHTRRLQAEVQMLLHQHPLNEARAARGELPLNSVWLSGTGPTPPAAEPGATPPQVDRRLRAPALAGDWAAWAQAWQALDADPQGPLAALEQAAAAGQPVALSLCGERHALTLRPSAPQPGWRRWLQSLGLDGAPAGAATARLAAL